MHTRHWQDVPVFESEHGEIVYELIGHSAGGSEAHSVARIVIRPGGASRKHYHPATDESYTILAGRARLELDGAMITLGPGEAVAIPAHKVHQIANESDEDLVFLAVCVPPWTPDNSVFLD